MDSDVNFKDAPTETFDSVQTDSEAESVLKPRIELMDSKAFDELISDVPIGVRALPREVVSEELSRFEEIVQSRDVQRGLEYKLPRATDARAYRFCVQDVIFAIWTMQHRKGFNDIYVETFLTSEVYKKVDEKNVKAVGSLKNDEKKTFERDVIETGYYDRFVGATAALLTILSEAYRVGVPFRVQFGSTVENGRIPLDVALLAARNQIRLRNADMQRPGVRKGLIEPDEGKALYLALMGFSPVLRKRLQALEDAGLLSAERAAYLVCNGVWTIPEIECLILCSPYPDLILSGEVLPERRLLYQYVSWYCHATIMGGMLDRALGTRDDESANDPEVKRAGLDVEDDERPLIISTEPRILARTYRCEKSANESTPLPRWECERNGKRIKAQPGELIVALLRPRVACDLERFLLEDLQTAAKRAEKEPKSAIVIVLVPFDYHDLSDERRRFFRAEAERLGVVLAICPDSVKELDRIAEKKFIAQRMKKDD